MPSLQSGQTDRQSAEQMAAELQQACDSGCHASYIQHLALAPLERRKRSMPRTPHSVLKRRDARVGRVARKGRPDRLARPPRRDPGPGQDRGLGGARLHALGGPRLGDGSAAQTASPSRHRQLCPSIVCALLPRPAPAPGMFFLRCTRHHHVHPLASHYS